MRKHTYKHKNTLDKEKVAEKFILNFVVDEIFRESWNKIFIKAESQKDTLIQYKGVPQYSVLSSLHLVLNYQASTIVYQDEGNLEIKVVEDF